MKVSARGLVFDVDVRGHADAPPVLLLHGFPQTAHCWRLLLPHLEGFRTIAPDQRGYSPGARPEGVDAYRVPELVADPLAILDALGVETAHVVGHDWGAAVAWQLGARHPDRVSTLTILSVPHPKAFIQALRTDDDQRQRSLYMRDFARPGYADELLADDAKLMRGMFGGLPEVHVDEYVTRAQEPGALDAWLRWYAAQRLEDIGDTPAVAVPTLYVWSDGDVALGRTAAEATANWVTGPYRFEVLAGVTHWIPEQAADALGGLLTEHLGPVPQPDRTVIVVPEDAVLEIYRAAQAARGLRPSAQRLARVQEKLDEGLLVVEDELRGFALGEPGRAEDGAGEPVPGLLHLSMVFVHPDHQREGVGAALVESLADEAWAHGYREVSVWTTTPEFYEACGLERTGRTQQVTAGTAVQLTAELEAPLREVVVHDSSIRLGQLLKLAELVDTGADAKRLLAEERVQVNGETETRRGRQLQDGDEVRAADQAVRVVLSPPGA